MNKAVFISKPKNITVYEKEQIICDVTTGKVLSQTKNTITKQSPEPDYIKIYYESMLAFNQIHKIPTSFLLSLSKFLEWSNDGQPMCVTINKRVKDIMQIDCCVSAAQLSRYIKSSVDNGLLFRTKYRAVYEVNPFMIAKGKWDSIKELRTQFDFIAGKWKRSIAFKKEEDS